MTSSGMIVSESYVLYAFCDFAAVGCHWICRNFQVERTSCPAASAIRSLCGFLHKGHRTGTIWDHLGRWRTLELAALTGSRDHGLLWLLVHLCVRCSLDLHLTWHGSHTQKCHRKQIGKKEKNMWKARAEWFCRQWFWWLSFWWLRSYVSDEYGMSDTEAGNLYAAYGFACTGSWAIFGWWSGCFWCTMCHSGLLVIWWSGDFMCQFFWPLSWMITPM